MPSHASASSHCGPYYWHEMWGTCGQIQTQLYGLQLIEYQYSVKLFILKQNIV